MQSFSDLFATNKLLALAAIFIVLVALVVIVLFLSRLVFGRRLSTSGSSRTRQPRLGVVDAFDLDRQRQLVIVRRDNVEHLVMIGGPNDLVIETAIVRAPANTLPTPPRDKDQSVSPSIAAVIAPVPPHATSAPPASAPSVTVASAPIPTIAPPPIVAPPLSIELPSPGPSAPPPAVPREVPPPPVPRAAPSTLPPRPVPPPVARPSLAPPPTPTAPRAVSPAPARPPVRPVTTPTRMPPLPTLPSRPAPVLPRDTADQASGGEPVARPEPANNRTGDDPSSARAPSTPVPAAEKRLEVSPLGIDKPRPDPVSVERHAAPPDPQPRPAAPPARSTPVRSIEGLESLEEEMAKLLGRPSVPPEKS